MAEEQFVGTVASVEDGTYGPVVKVNAGGANLRTVYIGERYEGAKPIVGEHGVFVIWRSDPKPGRKFGSAYLNSFSVGASPNGNTPTPNGYASQGSPQTPPDRSGAAGRDGDIIRAQWALNAALAARESGFVKVPEGDWAGLHGVANDFFAMAYEIAHPSQDQPLVEEPPF